MSSAKRKRIWRDWPVVIEDYRKSGKSIKQYCIKNNIKQELFMRWYKRLEGKVSSKPKKKTLGACDFIKFDMKANSSMTISFPGDIKISATNSCDTELLQSAIKCLKGSA